jgi:CRISPR/Cas system-associated exonuclease Cas4 (RecB family)
LEVVVTALPYDFHFSQASLQDYVECRRRFQLRYLLRQAWPALEAEPALENERRLQMGAAFHQLVQQHTLGLPAERLSSMVAARKDAGNELERWWSSYVQSGQELAGLRDVPGLEVCPETSLSAPFQNYRLVAKYDLIAVTPQGQVAIFDWKTSRKKPRRKWLAGRLQTRLYPYLLVQAGAHLNQGSAFQSDQVEMIYWYPEFPSQPERFPYSAERCQEDGEYLASLVGEIEDLEEDEFYLTTHVERCRFCTYRSLCERGVKAGELDEMEAGLDLGEAGEESGEDFDLDFEQIAEVEF